MQKSMVDSTPKNVKKHFCRHRRQSTMKLGSFVFASCKFVGRFRPHQKVSFFFV